MRKIIVCALVLTGAVVVGGLLALGVYATRIAPETGGAVAVVVAGWLAFNGKNKDKGSLKDRFHAPPFAIVVFILGLCSYFAWLEIIQNKAG